jgi:enoyl-CoA hydratase/carnithine racemase
MNGGVGAGTIRTEVRGGVLHMCASRPAKRNSYTPWMVEALARAYTALEREPDLRCGLLYAEGGDFTTGLDLALYAPLFRRGETGVPADCVDPFGLREPWRSKPVVVAIQGRCYTHGIELALAADIAVCERSARFAQLEVQRGIMPAGGATVRLVERAGWGRAMRWLLTGESFDADQALHCGLAQDVVADGEGLARAGAIADSIARAAPLAVQAVIASARASTSGAARQSELTALAARQARLAATEDAAEGVASFVERRQAVFRGR